MSTLKYTPELLHAAIEGFEAQRRRIDAQLAVIRQMVKGGRTESVAMSGPAKQKRKLSAAARKRIADAQKKRWAAYRKQSQPAAAAATPEALKPKRKLSAAGRKAIARAARKRWAAVKAAKLATT